MRPGNYTQAQTGCGSRDSHLAEGPFAREPLERFLLGCVLFLVGAKLVFALKITGLRLGDHKDRPYNGRMQLRTANEI
jgi:hypothetical protein